MSGVRLDLAYHGAGFSGWAAQPGERTVQGELEGAARADPGRTDAAHRRGQDRRRGPRLGSGGELRRRERAAGGARPGAQLAHRPRPGREGSRPGRRLRRPPRCRSRAPTATGCSPSEAPIPSRPGSRCSGRTGSTATRSPAAPTRSEAPMTSRRSLPRRRSTSASSATSCAAEWHEKAGGAWRRAACSSSGSRPTPSCATWSASWWGRCSRWRGAPRRSRTSRRCSRARRGSGRGTPRGPTASTWPRSATSA